MGPVADYCPDWLLTMLVLPHVGCFLIGVGGDPGFSDEPGVYFFDFATVTASTVTGWCVIASFVLSAVAGAGYMLYLIERAKKCLDFSATLFIIHLLICIIYGGWPASVTWWVVNGIGLAVMALLGEYMASDENCKRSPLPGTDQMLDVELDLISKPE